MSLQTLREKLIKRGVILSEAADDEPVEDDAVDEEIDEEPEENAEGDDVEDEEFEDDEADEADDEASGDLFDSLEAEYGESGLVEAVTALNARVKELEGLLEANREAAALTAEENRIAEASAWARALVKAGAVLPFEAPAYEQAHAALAALCADADPADTVIQVTDSKSGEDSECSLLDFFTATVESAGAPHKSLQESRSKEPNSLKTVFNRKQSEAALQMPDGSRMLPQEDIDRIAAMAGGKSN